LEPGKGKQSFGTTERHPREADEAGQERGRDLPSNLLKELTYTDHGHGHVILIIKVEDLLKRDKSFEKVLKRMEENLVKGRKRKYRVSVA